MPNHLTSVCTVTGPEGRISDFIALAILTIDDENFVQRKKFEFESIVTPPDIIKHTESGSQSDTGFFALTGLVNYQFACFPPDPYRHYQNRGFKVGPMTTPENFRQWLEENEPETLEKGALALQCFRETGHFSWYEWNIANWGTKWSAYEYKERSREPGRFVFKFQTAWSIPEPIFMKLVELFPELSFDLVTIDEGGPEYESRFCAVGCTIEKKDESDERYRFVYGRDRDHDDEE